MSELRQAAGINLQGTGPGQHGPSRASKVLAERNQAVVAVGAWVESGQSFLEHPADLALLTEELQAQKRRENEDNLRRFQDAVRQRVAHRAHIRSRPQPRTHPSVIPHRGTPHYQVMTHHVSTNEENIPSGTAAQHSSSPESSEAMRQVRLRLAACRLIQQERTASDLPGGRWNISPSRHQRADAHVQRKEEDVLEEEEQETSRVPLFGSQHECPLVQQKIGGLALLDLNNSHSDLSSNPNLRVPRVLWPMTDQEKMKKQRQSQFLMHRRLAMNTEREQVKENKQLRKHLKRTARIKAEKEKLRQEEEMKLERARMLAEAKQRLEERELLILERLKLEEEGAMQLQRRNREEKGKNSARFVEALRAQMKERLSQMKQELPPLCCCASSFWDSHPDTCANNCIFHNNPRAYAKALQSTMVSLDLQ